MNFKLEKALQQIESRILEWKYGVYKADNTMNSISEIVNKYTDEEIENAVE